MAERLADLPAGVSAQAVLRKIGEARQLYYRLILLVGSAGSGKTEALQEVLDNIEILFDVHLKQDPLRLLQGLSRNKTVVVAWNGSIVDGHMTYAVPDHPEYRRYPIRDFLVVSLEVTGR